MEVKLHTSEASEGKGFLFDVVNNWGEVVAHIETDKDIKNQKEAQEQAFVIACQMHLRRFDKGR